MPKGFKISAQGTPSIGSFKELGDFDEEVCNNIYLFSKDKLTRMAVVEIARLKGYPLGATPIDKLIA